MTNCQTCHYFSGNHHLPCAVHPTEQPAECGDYVADERKVRVFESLEDARRRARSWHLSSNDPADAIAYGVNHLEFMQPGAIAFRHELLVLGLCPEQVNRVVTRVHFQCAKSSSTSISELRSAAVDGVRLGLSFPGVLDVITRHAEGCEARSRPGDAESEPFNLAPFLAACRRAAETGEHFAGQLRKACKAAVQKQNE